MPLSKPAPDNDPAYVKMAENAVGRLRAILSDQEFTAWQERTFLTRPMEHTAARFVWIAALNEIKRNSGPALDPECLQKGE